MIPRGPEKFTAVVGLRRGNPGEFVRLSTALRNMWSGMRIFAVDVNGMKKPNKWGYDLFVLSVVSDNGSSLNLIPSYIINPVEKGGKTAKQMLTE